MGCKTDLRKDEALVNKLRKNRLEPVTYHRVGGRKGERAPLDPVPLDYACGTLRVVLEAVKEQELPALGNATSKTRNCAHTSWSSRVPAATQSAGLSAAYLG